MEEFRKETVLNILGTEWTLQEKSKDEDPKFKDFDGYTDRSAKLMVVRADQDDGSDKLQDYDFYLKEVKRHEIIHAYLFESGLGNEVTHPANGHDEVMIDWMAIQFPKMIKTFEEADAL